MNIAEIRKKARDSKPVHQAPESADFLNLNDENSSEESLTSMAKQPLPVSITSINPGPEPFSTNIVPANNHPAISEDRLDQLFSWVPQQDELLLESSSIGSTEKGSEAVSRRWLAFSLGSEDYALDISLIREILKPREITEIPRVPEFLLGIISLRGSIIPIFDLKRRMGLGVAEIDEDSRIIVCQDGDRLAGLLIDQITQVTSIQEKQIEPPPATFSGRDRALLDGVGRVQEKVLILLNLSSVLTIDNSGF